MNLSRRELFSVWRAAKPAVSDHAEGSSSRRIPFIANEACLAARSFCSVCIEHCREPGAITVSTGQPHIEPSRCTGCGACVTVCPAPVLAIRFPMPDAEGK